MQDRPLAPSASVVRALGGAALASVVVHVLLRFWLLSEGRYFATEDDGYRAYYGYLSAEGTASVISRFWLPGQFFVLGALGRLGLDAASAPLVLGSLCFGIMLASVVSLARDLAPEGWGEATARGAVILTALSPLVLVICHSALAEPLANALVAFAGMALVRRHHGGARRLVASGGLAMLFATWVRYEAWAYAGVFVVAAAWTAYRREGRRAAMQDAAMGSIAILGPLAWLLAQYLVYDDAFAFLDTIDEMSVALAGEASHVRVAAMRFEALACWAGGAVLASGIALGMARRQHATVHGLAYVAAIALPGLALQLLSGQGLGVFVIEGREVEFFAPRLVSNIEIGLIPLGGLGIAMLASRTELAARGVLAFVTLLVSALLVLGVAHPMAFVDASSIRAGLMLRRGELNHELGSGALIVERVEPRPPMGWASLSVLWSHWDRTVFLTRRGEVCELVEPSDVLDGRARIPCAALGVWAERRGVTAAWVLSDPARTLLEEVWPDAVHRPIGDGHLLVPSTASRVPNP